MARPKKEKPNHATGMYEVKVTVGKTFDGKPIRKSFYSAVSKAEAKAKAEEYIVNSRVAEQTGDQFVSSQTAFETWAKKWLETYKKPNVKPHTYKWTYETNVINYFIPYFGKAPLVSIRQIDIQNYFNKNSFLAMSTLSKQKMILFALFDAAIDNDLCYKNPVKNIKLITQKSEYEKRWYTENQANMLKEYCIKKNTKYAKAVYLLLSLGLRRGELLGLKWSDIDTDTCTVHVMRAVEPDTEGLPKDGEVKSKSALRSIPYDDNTRLIEFFDNNKSTGFVLSGETYGYTAIQSFDSGYKEFMKKATSTLDIPYMSPHELRHSYGSILRERGLDLYSIARLMGHSDSKITEKHYIGNDIEVLRNRLKNLNQKQVKT